MDRYITLMDTFESDLSLVPNTDSEFTFAFLLLTITSVGGSYALLHPARRKRASAIYEEKLAGAYAMAPPDLKYDIDIVFSQLLAVIRIHLFDMLSCCTIASVQSCILLSHFYGFHGNPSLAWTIVGNAIKITHALGLHRKSSAVGETPAAVEIRQRVFWAVYCLDHFTTIAYGLPPGLIDNDCDVDIPSDSEAHGAAKCHSHNIPFISIEDDIRPSTFGSNVTLLTYQTLQVQYYIIMSDVITSLYRQKTANFSEHIEQFSANYGVHRSTSTSDRIEAFIRTAQRLEAKIKAWHQEIPSALKLKDDGSYGGVEFDGSGGVDQDDDNSADDIYERRQQTKNDVFSVEALLLELFYTNAMILIHRPMLGFSVKNKKPSIEDPFSQSADTCWRAALRTARLSKHPFFSTSRQIHIVASVSLLLFTAGVLLSIFGSSEPLSQCALESKLGLSRIIQMRKALRNRVALAEPGSRILESLARVVMEKEMEKILSGDGNMSAASMSGVRDIDDDRSAAAALTSLSYQLAHGGGSSPNGDNATPEQSAPAVVAYSGNGRLTNTEKINGGNDKAKTEKSRSENVLAVIADGEIEVIENLKFKLVLASLQPSKFVVECPALYLLYQRG